VRNTLNHVRWCVLLVTPLTIWVKYSDRFAFYLMRVLLPRAAPAIKKGCDAVNAFGAAHPVLSFLLVFAWALTIFWQIIVGMEKDFRLSAGDSRFASSN
jgi:hypothetical protein